MNEQTVPFADLVIEVSRLHGELLDAGDRLVADVGLTSARWQVLAAIQAAPVPQSVAQLARNMGLTRQAVHRIVDDLEADRHVVLVDNPHHARARLVVMTKAGSEAYREALGRHKPFTEELAAALNPEELAVATRVIRTIRARLDGLA